MADVNILSEKPMNIFELKEELKKIKKRDEELNFRANKTEEYLTQIPSFKKSKELYEKIDKLKIPRLREQHINKIIDILPTTVEELKVILQGYTITVNNENLKKIVNTVNSFIEKK